MITKDGSIVRIVPIVDTSAIRQAMQDEDGHIRELSATEWGKFSWDCELPLIGKATRRLSLSLIHIGIWSHQYPRHKCPGAFRY